MSTLGNSTFLDLTSYGTTAATAVEGAHGATAVPAVNHISASGHGWLS
jgi:hypothetical protein